MVPGCWGFGQGFVSLTHIAVVTCHYSCMLVLRTKLRTTVNSMEVLLVFLSGTNCAIFKSFLACLYFVPAEANYT